MSSRLASTYNSATWVSDDIELTDDTGAVLPLADYTAEVELSTDRGTRVLYGSSDDGIVTKDATSFMFQFTAAQMAEIVAGTYRLNIRITSATDDTIDQVFSQNFVVLDGGF